MLEEEKCGGETRDNVIQRGRIIKKKDKDTLLDAGRGGEERRNARQDRRQ